MDPVKHLTSLEKKGGDKEAWAHLKEFWIDFYQIWKELLICAFEQRHSPKWIYKDRNKWSEISEYLGVGRGI